MFFKNLLFIPLGNEAQASDLVISKKYFQMTISSNMCEN